MATKKISELDTIASIDRAADYLEVSDTSEGASKKATPNTILGITGNPVGHTDSQTLANKTLTSPIISGPTLSGTIIGTYTIGGTPTFPSSVATLTGNQVLTNKTLTSPTINTATISNPTLTTDTVSEYTSANGVTVDGLNIKDGKLNTNNSVVAANITSGILTNSMLSTVSGELGGAWQSWTPTLSGMFTDGDWTKTCKYIQIGKTVFYRLHLTATDATPMAGGVNTGIFTLPVTSVSYGTAVREDIGHCALNDDTGSLYTGTVLWASTTTANLYVHNSSGTYSVVGALSSTVPFTWTTSDVVYAQGFYEAA